MARATGGTVTWDPGTVVVTGGTGGLGALVTRHLVEEHGVSDVLLLSRRGVLPSELSDLGRVRSVACDVSDRAALAAVLDGETVTGVIHAAGVLDDGVVEALTPERLGTVLAPKADAAWYLHELTPEATNFVLFSSAAGTFGNAGQANYAAANAFLDALAEHRNALGLPAVSLAWGPWDTEGMAERLTRSGTPPLSPALGLRLLDTATDAPTFVTTRLDLAAIRRHGHVPPLLRGLVRTTTRRRTVTGTGVALRNRLAGLRDTERRTALLDLVRTEAAAVLGLPGGDRVQPDQPFRDLGFDSLIAVEFRNRLGTVTGLRLPATLVFDHPTGDLLVTHLLDELFDTTGNVTDTVTSAVDGDPIVVVGMACRYPGGITTPEQLWEFVTGGGDAITPVPGNRAWDTDALLGPDAPELAGGFLADAGLFDPGFFGMSPREALATDAQQRLLLEVSWEALERAGVDPVSLRGSRTGVFAGVMYNDYGMLLQGEEFTGFRSNGSSPSVVSGRVAYTFGFEGPAMTVDTACSSSLVAMHLAAQALRSGECTLALAGGVTVMSTPTSFVEFARQGGLAPDGRCKAFGDSADGVGWSEGVGIVVLARQSDAERLGYPVLAVVKGSAVNSDGASNGLTAPNGPSQQRVIRQALANAGLSARDVDVVEAHGTGTTLGDPIEAQALLATYGQDRESPLLLGSVKSNLGHTQAAAGVAGIVKVIMAMRHGVVPPTLHADTPSSHVDWSAGAIELATSATDWPAMDRARRVAVSSFGLSGTNAHIILEAPSTPAPALAPVADSSVPLAVSAKSAAVLDDQLAFLSEVDAAPLDIGFSLARRSLFTHRAVLLDGVEIARGAARPGRLGFVFAGQGAQRLGMGRELYDRFPVFAAAFDEVVDRFPGLREVMWGDAGALTRTGWAQPALFALEVALFRLVEWLGVRPDVLVGHSIGEIAAAYVAGVFSLEDACSLVGARARLMEALPEGGVMVAVRTADVTLTEGVSVAAINGPDNVVLAGVEAEVMAAVGDRDYKRLEVSHAFHSPLMDPMLDDFREAIAGISFHEPVIPLVKDVSNLEYWVRHVRETVRFADDVAAAEADTFLEIGPDGTLSALIDGIPSLRKDRDEKTAFFTAVARLHVTGSTVDWTPLLAGGRLVELPTYAFHHEWFWPHRSHQNGEPTDGHPLLGAVVALADSDEYLSTARISLGSHPWLADHVIGGQVLVPGAALLELAIRAGDDAGCGRVERLTLAEPLTVPDRGGVHVQVRVGAPDPTGSRAVTIHSRPGDAGDLPWTANATGLLSPTAGTARPAERPADAQPVPIDGCYDGLADAGFAYGPHFQALRAAWRHGGDVYAEVALADTVTDAARFGLHPALLDAGLHAVMVTGEQGGQAELPFEWQGVTLHATGATAAHLRLTRHDNGLAIDVTDETGAPVLTVDTLSVRPVDLARPPADPRREALFGLEWTPVGTPADPATVPFVGPDPFGGNGTLADIDAVADEPVVAVFLSGVPDVIPAAHRVAARALHLAQRWLAADRPGRLVFVTRGVVDGEDVAAATVWGLVRSAQSEHPGRFGLLDLGLGATPELVARALATDEPQLSVTASGATAPRLARLTGEHDPSTWDPDGTVMITGGTGGLGALVATHLARGHGVRHLLLLSRRGPAAAGDLVEDIADLGATATVVACDVTDRAALEKVLADIPAAHPLTAVVHTAGVLDDGVLGALSPERMDTVLAPKLDAAWHLHELTAGHDLTAFVVFSSAAGTFGGPGQGNYAAANAALDALMTHRSTTGLPGVSLAWGPWDQAAGMTGGLTEAEARRLAASGLPPITPADGLALFDAALSTGAVNALPVQLDLAAFRGRGTVPPLLRGLVRTPTRRASAGGTPDPAALAAKLAGLDQSGRTELLLDLVRTEVASVLGHTDTAEIEPDRQFRDLGFDSLTAVELRNRLGAVTGLRLPATMVFDHPTPEELVARLGTELGGDTEPGAALLATLAALEKAFGAVEADASLHQHVAGRLEVLRARWAAGRDGGEPAEGPDLDNVSDDEMFAFLDGELDPS
ncbi:polyketide synthase [Actinophytocola xinjiangensis]|uniref:Polyketide synthase n=1 Tax=Actinophytocola xinjiangensis TaxID=485602 RepID=A0A7Z1AV52_9PSEU|nr:polyketide synthase [Actinophytocola xinjiangensis]